MPVHAFRCRSCDAYVSWTFSVHDTIPDSYLCECGSELRRIWEAPSFHTLAEHFNHSLGRTVTSRSDFENKLYEAQEKMTERLGYQQHYVTVDPSETKVTDEGMKATHDVRRTQGSST